MPNTKIIVVTLVKDEAWMLDRFLATCSHFADHIIVSDESSGFDNSLNIYKKYPKVILHHNPGAPVRGDIRRRFVFQEARKIPCDKRIIIAIDSDEIISANILQSSEWQTVLNAEPGTLVHLQWVTLWESTENYRADLQYLHGNYYRHIWVDDGFSEIPAIGFEEMHMAYTPLQAKTHIYLNDIVCLHYQFCNWRRMEAKHRYYRVHEKANVKRLSDLAIYRIYGYMYSKNIRCRNSLNKWFEGWTNKDIDMTSICDTEIIHYDINVLDMFLRYGPSYFSWQDIWRADWDRIISLAKEYKMIPKDFIYFRPKRTFFNRLFQLYLRTTIDCKYVRYIEAKIFKKSFSY